MEFEVEVLSQAVLSYLIMQVQPSNCCSIWNAANAASYEQLEERCMHEIASSFEEVATYDDFLELEEEALGAVMRREDLQCTEEKIFEALLCWVNYRQAGRQQALDRLLPLVRLPLIDNVYLQDYVEGNSLLRKSKVASKLLTEAYKYQASPAHRRHALMNQRSTQRQTLGAQAPRLMDSLQYAPHSGMPAPPAPRAGSFVPNTVPNSGQRSGGYMLAPGGAAASAIVPAQAGHTPANYTPAQHQPMYGQMTPSYGHDPRDAALTAAGAIERARASVQAKQSRAAGAPPPPPVATPQAGAPVVGPYVAAGGAVRWQ